MPKRSTKQVGVKNPPQSRQALQDREDARDMAFIQRNRGKFRFTSWNRLMKELGYHDLQTVKVAVK